MVDCSQDVDSYLLIILRQDRLGIETHHDTSCYEDIVSEVQKGGLKSQFVASRSSRAKYGGEKSREGEALEWVVWKVWRAYRTREPSPYWPLTGKAHTTCKAVAVVLAVALAAGVGMPRPESVPSSAVEIEGSAGIVKQMCARIAAKRWSARVIYLRPPGIRVTELLADDRETKEAEGRRRASMAELGQVSLIACQPQQE